MMGLSTSGSISLGWALVAGRKRVPSPAAGNTALRTLIVIAICSCGEVNGEGPFYLLRSKLANLRSTCAIRWAQRLAQAPERSAKSLRGSPAVREFAAILLPRLGLSC